jgi:hypothetical protein
MFKERALELVDEFIALTWFCLVMDLFYIAVSLMLCVIPGKEFNYSTLHTMFWCIGTIGLLEVIKLGIKRLWKV